MTASVRERALAAFDNALFAALAADGGAPVTRLERARQRDIDDGQRPAVVVVGGGEERLEAEASGQDEYRMTVEVWGYVQAATNDPSVETALNDLYARVVAALAADLHLGGLVDDVRLLRFSHDLVDAGGARTADFVAEFAVEYATAEGDPYQRP